MAGEDLGLADRLVREKATGGLGVGPVLTGQGDGRTNRVCQLHEELAQPPAQPFVLERRARELLVYPGGGMPAGTIHRAPGLYVSVLDNTLRPGRSAQAQSCIPQMWVIGRSRQRLPSCGHGSGWPASVASQPPATSLGPDRPGRRDRAGQRRGAGAGLPKAFGRTVRRGRDRSSARAAVSRLLPAEVVAVPSGTRDGCSCRCSPQACWSGSLIMAFGIKPQRATGDNHRRFIPADHASRATIEIAG